jgi:hypothetical protein
MSHATPVRDSRYSSWYAFVYLPHRVASWFIRRTPQIYVFGGDKSSLLVRQLGGVNVLAPTRMCRIMTKHGSDKGRRWHNYTTVYAAILDGYRGRPLRIFELGLGTNNPELVSSMGVTGRPGASLRGWREIFPQASIYGADIDRAILFEEERIKTYYCDQLDQEAIRALWSEPALRGGMDILIEDGLHSFEGNISFLDGSLAQVRPGGIYVIEDIATDTIERWRSALQSTYAPRYPDYQFVLVVLPNAQNRADNNLLVIRRAEAKES